jgi:hypothetical protein
MASASRPSQPTWAIPGGPRRQRARQQGEAQEREQNEGECAEHAIDRDRGDRQRRIGRGAHETVDAQSLAAERARHEIADEAAHEHEPDDVAEPDRNVHLLEEGPPAIGGNQAIETQHDQDGEKVPPPDARQDVDRV